MTDDASWPISCLQMNAHRDPDGIAVREHVVSGARDTSWSALRDAASAVAEQVRPSPRGDGPTLVVLDGSADAVAVVAGLMAAGCDILVVEAGNSHLIDGRSLLHRARHGPMVTPAPADGTVSYRELITGARQPAVGTGAVHQLTSGSTGGQRIVRQTVRSVGLGAETYRDRYGYTPADRILLPIPLAHSFGLVGGLSAALKAGARLETLSPFSVSGLHRAISGGATIILGTPLLYRLLADTATAGPGALRLLLSSGGPMTDDTTAAVRRALSRPVHQVYGSTETGLIASQYPRPEPWPPGSVGAPAPGVTCRIVDGLLFVRTPAMFDGYLDDGTVAGGPADGWYDTGDLAQLRDGVLSLAGRKRTFVNVGGRKVSPDRVEQVLAEHDAVREAHVFGRDGRADDEEVHAAVVPAGPAAPAAELIAHCRARLASHEVPRRVHLLPALPRTVLGKVDRNALLDALGLSTARSE